MIVLLAAGWLLVVVAFLIVWGGFHARVRAAEGIDEDAYIHGRDERSLAEVREEQALLEAA